MSDLDITGLILGEHEDFRRSFAALGEIADRGALSDRWQDLADRLEVHASAEEELFYPRFLALPKEVDDDVADETDDAIGDHDEIRDAAREAGRHEVGSDEWWAAVHQCRDATTEHLGEEENDVLPAFQEGVPAAERAQLGERWLAYHEKHEHAAGLSGEDKDPKQYVAEHSPGA